MHYQIRLLAFAALSALAAWFRSGFARTLGALQIMVLLLATSPAWGALAIDVMKSTDRSAASTSITSPAFTTTSANELLLAFVSTDAKSNGIAVNGVSGGGLTWVLVQRTNAQLGTAEIWRALATSPLTNATVTATLSQSVAASITVVSFTGVDTSGSNGSGAIGATAGGSAASGAPSASLITTRNGSWVFGVGNDWDKAVARSPGPNQTLVHQYLATIGDTYWVQQQTAPTPNSGTTVVINDTAPTSDRYNLSIVEILPAATTTATWSISGTITPGASGSGATVSLSGAASATASADANGLYSFAKLANGNYTVTPSKSGFVFTPVSQNVTINGSNATGVNFTAQASTPPPGTGSDWLTYGHDPQRSGNAAGESTITPSSVKNLSLQWSAVVDGKVTAQPLFASGVQIAGQTRNVLIVATANNSVYALDATTGAQLWRTHFNAPSGQGDVPGGFGISGTPVIDRASNRIYAVTDDGFLRTLSLGDGSAASPALQVITDNPGTNSVWGGLNLVAGNLYIPTASNGPDTQPWWGRIIRVNVAGATPAVTGLFKVVPSIAAPNGGGGIWGYGGVSVDPGNGRVYAATAADNVVTNNQESYTPYSGRMVALAADLGYSQAAQPLGNPLGTFEPPHPSPCPGDPGVCDMDFGATPILYQPPGCPSLVAAVNKDGNIHVLQADDLAGRNNETAAHAPPLQSLPLNIAFDGPGAGGLTGIPAYWPSGNMLFVTDGGPGITDGSGTRINAGVVGMSVAPAPSCSLKVAWSVDWSNIPTPLAGQDQPPSSPTVANGVIFVGSGVNGSIHAFDGNTGTELWNSGSAIAGGATFAAPIVASGTLYTASWNGFNANDGGTIRAFAPGAVPPPPPSSNVLLGDQVIESLLDENALGQPEAFQTIASASGTVGTLSIYVDASSTATTLVAGLYADAGGHPGALIAQGSISQVRAGAWNNVSIPGAIVASGNPYWIAVLGTQSGILRFRDGKGTCKSETSAQANLTALPSSWVTGAVYSTCPLSGYGISTGQ